MSSYGALTGLRPVSTRVFLNHEAIRALQPQCCAPPEVESFMGSCYSDILTNSVTLKTETAFGGQRSLEPSREEGFSLARLGTNRISCAVQGAHEGGIFALCMLRDGTLVSGGGKDRKLISWNGNYQKLHKTEVSRQAGPWPSFWTLPINFRVDAKSLAYRFKKRLDKI